MPLSNCPPSIFLQSQQQMFQVSHLLLRIYSDQDDHRTSVLTKLNGSISTCLASLQSSLPKEYHLGIKMVILLSIIQHILNIFWAVKSVLDAPLVALNLSLFMHVCGHMGTGMYLGSQMFIGTCVHIVT